MKYRVSCSYMGCIGLRESFPKTVEECEENDLESEFPTFKFFNTEKEALKHIGRIWFFGKPWLDLIDIDGNVTSISVPNNLKSRLINGKLFINGYVCSHIDSLYPKFQCMERRRRWVLILNEILRPLFGDPSEIISDYAVDF